VVQATEEHVARGPWLDPEIAARATTAPARNLLEDGQLAALRATNAQLPPYRLSAEVNATDHPVSEQAFVRVYRPRHQSERPIPAVYSIHGGGMVVGSVAMDNARFDRLCQEHACVGVSIEYRLPPETPYPGPLDDCLAGWR
jgi:acetyl esterase/lipase